MATQMAPDLLQHEVGRLRAQHRSYAALVGFEFVEDAFDLPALRVRDREINRGCLVGVEDRGEQPIRLLNFIADYDQTAAPFKWTYAADPLVA